ncbi:MAG TPA: Hsp20/alpha crystallin family protein [Lacunisphaera sp.]
MYHITRYQYPRTASVYPSLAARSQLAGLESEIDRLFSSALADFAAPTVAPRFPVDLFEDKDNHYVRAELPGVSRDAINVEMVDGYLTVSATRKEGEESFSLTRSVSIPEAVQADKVAATYENGVLTVTLPKQEKAKPRKIAININ